MKRPLALFATGYVAATAAVFAFQPSAALCFTASAFAALLFAAALFGACKEHRLAAKRAAVLAAALALALCAAGLREDRVQTLWSRYAGKQAVVCRVTAVDSSGFGYSADVRVENVGGEKTAFNARLECSEELRAGDRISARAEFDGADGTRLSGSVEDVTLLECETGLYGSFGRFRGKISSALITALGGDEGAVASAMLTGEKSSMSSELQRAFRYSGLSHVLVVSGLHLSVMAYVLYRMLTALKLGARYSKLIMLPFVALMMLAVGLTPSIVRAGIMTGLAYLGALIGLEYDGVTSMAFSALVLAVFDPGCLGDYSFVMSYACTFALITVYTPLEKRILSERYKTGADKSALTRRRLLCALLLPGVITCVTLPINIVYGMSVSLVAPIGNLMVIWLLPAILALSVLTAALFALFGGAWPTAVAAAPLRLICAAVSWLCRRLGALEYAAFDGSSPVLRLWLICCCAALPVIFLAVKAKKRRIATAAAVFAALLLVCVTGIGAMSRECRSTELFTDYDGNVSVLLDTPNGDALLYCGDRARTQEQIAEWRKLNFRGTMFCVLGEEMADSQRLNDVFGAQYVKFSDEYPAARARFTLRDGEMRLEFENGRFAWGVMEQGGLKIGLLYDCPEPLTELMDCDIIIISGQPPEWISEYSGETAGTFGEADIALQKGGRGTLVIFEEQMYWTDAN